MDDSDEGGSVAGVWATPVSPDALTTDAQHPFSIDNADRYDRGGLLGAGGMGRVFTARDRRLNREVALKEVTVSAGRSGADRLAQEAWITAQLEHPNIVPVHDAGTDAEGTPWYTMRLIRGRTLHDVLDGADRATRLGTLRHVLAACEAVAYAHSRGIIHRDLKPQNILVGGFGETQVADWGLARPLDGEQEDWQDVVPAEHGAATMVGAAVGTPAWMSPEQIRGEPATRRSDVWSLGAVLRQVLTGRPPYAGVAPEQILSQRLASGDEHLERTLDGPDTFAARAELEAIVRRAMAPLAWDRYADAAALSADLARYLDGRRVHAHEYSAVDLLRRLGRLWRAPLVVGVIGAALVLAAVAVGYRNTAVEQRRAQRNLAQALLVQARAAQATGDRPRAEVLATEILAIAESPAARGILALFAGTPPPAVSVTPAATDGCDAVRMVDATLWTCARGRELSGHRIGSDAALWTRTFPYVVTPLVADGGLLFASMKLDVLEQLDPATGATLRTLPTALFPEQVRRSPDGRYVAAWRAHHLVLWDLEDGTNQVIQGCGPPTVVTSATFGARGLFVVCADFRRGWVDLAAPTDALFPGFMPPEASGTGLAAVASIGADRFVLATHRGQLHVYDAARDTVSATLDVSRQGLVALATDPAGSRVAIRGERGDVWLWNVDAPQATPLPGRARSLLFPSDDRLLVLGSDLRTWSLSDVASPRAIDTSAGVSALRVSSRGAIATATGHGHVILWDPDARRVDDVPLVDAVIKDLTFAPDGAAVLASTAHDQPAQLAWIDTDTLAIKPVTAQRYLRRMELLHDGSLVAVNWGEYGPLHAPSPDAPAAPLAWAPRPTFGLAVDRSRTHVASLADDRVVRVGTLGPNGLALAWERPLPDAVSVAIHRSGQVAVGVPDGALLIDATGATTRLAAPALQVITIAFSPDGRTLAGGDLSGRIWVWDVPSARLIAELRGHESRVSGLAFRGDGELVSGSWDTTVRRWDLAPARAPLADLRRATVGWGLDLQDVLTDQ